MFPTVTTDYPLTECIPDPDTDRRLLPSRLAPGDNSRRLRHYRTALHRAMTDGGLSPVQVEQLRLHYGSGLRKSEIAALQSRTCSAVSKSIRAGLAALQDYIEMYMEIYDDLEREFLREEEAG